MIMRLLLLQRYLLVYIAKINPAKPPLPPNVAKLSKNHVDQDLLVRIASVPNSANRYQFDLTPRSRSMEILAKPLSSINLLTLIPCNNLPASTSIAFLTQVHLALLTLLSSPLKPNHDQSVLPCVESNLKTPWQIFIMTAMRARWMWIRSQAGIPPRSEERDAS